MGLFDNFPYTNFHELNLDWILKVLKDIETTIDQFVSLNIIKYADPIQWDITRQYPKNTIVIDPISGTAYISVDNVPQGVPLSNTDYWGVVFDLGRFITLASQNFALSYEPVLTTTATVPTIEGGWVVWNSLLYEALNDIHVGDMYVENGNIKKTPVEEFFNRLKSEITINSNHIAQEILDRQGADNALGGRIDQEILDRQVADNALGGRIDQEILDRQGADNALGGRIDQEILDRQAADNDIKTIIGSLTDLQTSNKTSIVNAINSVVNSFYARDYVCPEDFGAVGDGVADDTLAVQQAFDDGRPVRFINDYAVTTVTYSNSENYIDFNGHWLIGIGNNNDYVLVIYEAMYNVFNNVQISISLNSRSYYYGCIRIHSSATRQSQYNVFNDVYLKECWHGIVWGAKDGETSVSNAQSETFINNFRDRSVAVPFLGNQNNGYITFVGGVFDINQYEQWPDTRFSFDDNSCVVNHVGKVNFIGCEFAATINVNHIGFVGGDIHAYDSIIEICGTQAFITGDFSLINWYNGYIGQIAKTPFIVNNGTKGTIIIANGTFHHGGVVGTNNLFYGYDAPETVVYLDNVTFADTPYALDMFGNLNVKCNNFALPTDNITINDNDDITGLALIDNNSSDPLAFGEQYNCIASFDSILGKRGVAVQFTSGTEGGYYTPMIPIYGGTLYHANSCGFTDGNNVYIYLEFYDANDAYIGAELIQTINGIRLNRSKIQYAPANAKKCRIRISNGSTAPQVYTITCNIAIYWKKR